MAKILFAGTDESDTANHTLTVYPNSCGEIYIAVHLPSENIPGWIALDVDTAVQFSKELKKSIAKLKNDSNG